MQKIVPCDSQALMVAPTTTTKKLMIHRFRLSSKHNLQIHGIRSQDAGDYTCKIQLLGEQVSITHTLEILGEFAASVL